ncbi:MAG: hypothetical protein HXY43_04540 [Fischerella sp.]|jgi:hypothetical protein|uniref:hypothetical protein n=1 Tax=Fischerella sp. TaxID=1191 RepID=UPI0017B23F29|nr:hypothetical protein [Fischerella sp.]NWF58583.1 hypothetical protein [Fischerella sp.]
MANKGIDSSPANLTCRQNIKKFNFKYEIFFVQGKVLTVSQGKFNSSWKAFSSHRIFTGEASSVAGSLLRGKSLENTFVNLAVSDRSLKFYIY